MKFHCDTIRKLTRVQQSNGTWHIKAACTTCGTYLGYVSHLDTAGEVVHDKPKSKPLF